MILGWGLLVSMQRHAANTAPVRGDTTAPAYLHAKEFRGRNISSADGVVHWTTGLDNDHYQIDSLERTGHFYVEVQIDRLVNMPQKRKPLNLSIVIDRSGSMQGVKMGFTKRAAKGLIDRLEASDMVSIVMFDNAIDSVQGPVLVTDKEMIKSKIDHITPRGSTNLWGGTELGYEFVHRNYRPGSVNRVLLISDGLANVGITDSGQIIRNVARYKDAGGMSLSTFGVGLDYNETLMTAMAENGGGHYYYIDAPERLPVFFDQELNTLMNAVAQDALITIRLPDGVHITKSYPLPFTQSGNLVYIRLQDLFALDTRTCLFDFRIDNKLSAPLSFTATLHYLDVLDGKEKELVNKHPLLPVKANSAYLADFNKPVIGKKVLFTANENMEKALNEVDRGALEEAGKTLRANRSYLAQHHDFVATTPELQRADSLNARYLQVSGQAGQLPADSLKKIQKSVRAANYRLRTNSYYL